MASNDEFDHESLQDTASIASYLRALADGFEKGHLSLASNGRDLHLEPRGLLRLAISAKRSKQRARVVVKIGWRTDEAEKLERDPLKVSAGRD